MAVGDGPPEESMDVWWLQAPSRHADLRTPRRAGSFADPVLSFAGTTTWDGAWLTWTPDLTLVPSDRPDTGLVSWDGDDLMEAGTFDDDGVPVPYVERWRRLPDSATPMVALSSPGGRLVRTGAYALTILDRRDAGGAYTAVAWRLVDDAWTVERTYPHGGVAPPPPLELTGPTVRLSDGQDWTVDENSN
jgi:hypothetical protein